MPTPTYVPLGTITLASTDSEIVFSSIPASYRDLILVAAHVDITAAGRTRIQVNADTGANYTRVRMYSSGGSPTSNSGTLNYVELGYYNSGQELVERHQFLDYSATDKHKPVLSRGDNVDSSNALIIAAAHRWANTTAINQIKIYRDTGSFGVGSTFSLYGVN